MELSVVIPVYNEEENVEPLIQEITAVVAALGKKYEIVVVDDGSEDNTFPTLAQLHYSEPHLRVVRLKRNFGQTAAVATRAGASLSRPTAICKTIPPTFRRYLQNWIGATIS